ncbi:MAG: DUF3800 domain-containing protein [Acidobacteria bacterium]|nr:DUF3800 domain-containing protein [Acidobacteriota bacterium]
MSESFVAYIDEAGDEGFLFSEDPRKGSSDWLCLSGVVVRKSNDLQIVEVGKAARQHLGWKKDRFFHFQKMKHNPRRVLLSHIVSPACPVRCISVLCHKPSLLEPERFRTEDRLYFYLARLLLERISWLCRDRRLDGEGDGRVRIVFSHRRRMSYEDLRDYLETLRSASETKDVRIDWSVVDPELVAARESQTLMGLQIADAVASSFFTGLNLSGYGLTEPGYASGLKPIVYHQKGRYQGYGVKVVPPDVVGYAAREKHTAWLFDVYK